MAKGWTKVKTVNDVERKKIDSKTENDFNVLIRNTKSLPAEKLKKNSEILYDKKIEEENKLLFAFDNKLIKSKEAIKRALRIKKQREKLEANKADINTEQKEEPDSTKEEQTESIA